MMMEWRLNHPMDTRLIHEHDHDSHLLTKFPTSLYGQIGTLNITMPRLQVDVIPLVSSEIQP